MSIGRRFAPAVLTGVLGGLAFPPFDLGPLILVAPAPLLWAWSRAERPRTAAADGAVAGAVFFGITLAWVWFFGVVAYGPFVAVLAGYWALAGAVVGAFAARGRTSPWLVAAVWVLLEALRGRWPFGGFSWGEAGYALHDVPAARSLAGWGGVLLVSYAVIVTAGYVVRAAVATRAGERRAAGTALATVAGVVVVASLAHVSLPETDPAGSVRVAIVQGNDKNRDLTGLERGARYLPVSHFALAEQLDDSVDLAVLPESSLDEDPRIDPFLEERIADIARRLDAAVLANAAVEIDFGRRLHNTNFLYDPGGGLVDTYVKRHLVPFGEYVPGRRFLEGIVPELEQIPRDHAPGDQGALFEVGAVRFANLICFESAFTELSRDYADDGAEILMVSTNNRSFRRSANSAQHLAIGQMRAAETGRPLVQAAISGRSAFIDADGDVVATTDLFERTTLVRTVEGRTGRTPYVALGDWVLLVAGAVVVATAARLVWATQREAGDSPREAGDSPRKAGDSPPEGVVPRLGDAARPQPHDQGDSS